MMAALISAGEGRGSLDAAQMRVVVVVVLYPSAVRGMVGR